MNDTTQLHTEVVKTPTTPNLTRLAPLPPLLPGPRHCNESAPLWTVQLHISRGGTERRRMARGGKDLGSADHELRAA